MRAYSDTLSAFTYAVKRNIPCGKTLVFGIALPESDTYTLSGEKSGTARYWGVTHKHTGGILLLDTDGNECDACTADDDMVFKLGLLVSSKRNARLV